MALSDDESRAAYKVLSEATHSCGLDWVLAQVEERITFGKTAVKKVKTTAGFAGGGSGEFAARVDPLAPGPAATFVVADSYSPAESLELLVDALLMAVPSVHETARHMLIDMRKFGSVDSIVFADDRPSSEPRELHSDELDSHSQAVSRVEKLLEELKKELQDASAVDSSR